MEIQGARVVITGGSTGIGRAAAVALSRRGARVVIAASRPERLADTAASLRADGHDVIGIPADITDLTQVGALAKAAFDMLGGVDIAVFNAGIAGGDRTISPELSTWRRSFDVNVFGLLHCIKSFVPRMIEQGTPTAVYATTSGAGIHGTNYRSGPYAASKNAQLTIMESLYGHARDEFADLRVGVIVPPLTRTNLVGDDLGAWDAVEAALSRGGKRAALIEPEEFAEVIADGVEQDRFWIEATVDDDERHFGGRYGAAIGRSHKLIAAKAAAMTNSLAPDKYLW